MGSYMIFDVHFLSKKDRLSFERHLKTKYINCKPLTFYHKEENKDDIMQDVVYYVGYLGYAEPEIILKDCLKKKINITFMAWLPISDTHKDLTWTKIRGRW